VSTRAKLAQQLSGRQLQQPTPDAPTEEALKNVEPEVVAFEVPAAQR